MNAKIARDLSTAYVNNRTNVILADIEIIAARGGRNITLLRWNHYSNRPRKLYDFDDTVLRELEVKGFAVNKKERTVGLFKKETLPESIVVSW